MFDNGHQRCDVNATLKSMCDRYFRYSEKHEIAEQYRVGKVFGDPLAADYNIAPQTVQPVIRLNRDSGEREMALLRWGMVPAFATSLKEFKGAATSNARAEAMTTSATWRDPLKRHRCLIPADGFYEWAPKAGEMRARMRAQSKGGKQPFAITLTGDEPMAFAGLWDAWKEPKKSPQEVDRWLQSFAIVTTTANETLTSICERMPVVLRRGDWDEWLSCDDSRPAPVHLLRPYDFGGMRMQPCNPAVGNVRRNGPEMLAGAITC